MNRNGCATWDSVTWGWDESKCGRGGGLKPRPYKSGFRFDVTASAVGNRERHTPVAPPAEFPVDNLYHRNRVGPFFHHEDVRVTVPAIQPIRVGKVGKDHVRHGPNRRDINV